RKKDNRMDNTEGPAIVSKNDEMFYFRNASQVDEFGDPVPPPPEDDEPQYLRRREGLAHRCDAARPRHLVLTGCLARSFVSPSLELPCRGTEADAHRVVRSGEAAQQTDAVVFEEVLGDLLVQHANVTSAEDVPCPS